MDAGWNDWNKADLGSDDRKQKFLKLMGAGKGATGVAKKKVRIVCAARLPLFLFVSPLFMRILSLLCPCVASPSLSLPRSLLCPFLIYWNKADLGSDDRK